mmetsp:Transcript_21022/g.40731  ORF Transcript_21022/g.40731 Transcript_21022/m.40731 type:complete len:108 (+) Transcript_21022:255-578(+)
MQGKAEQINVKVSLKTADLAASRRSDKRVSRRISMQQSNWGHDERKGLLFFHIITKPKSGAVAALRVVQDEVWMTASRHAFEGRDIISYFLLCESVSRAAPAIAGPG